LVAFAASGPRPPGAVPSEALEVFRLSSWDWLLKGSHRAFISMRLAWAEPPWKTEPEDDDEDFAAEAEAEVEVEAEAGRGALAPSRMTSSWGLAGVLVRLEWDAAAAAAAAAVACPDPGCCHSSKRLEI